MSKVRRLVRWSMSARNQPAVFLGLLGIDLVVNTAASKQQVEDHFDRMRIQPAVRKAIMPVKVAGTLGMLAGRRSRRIGALTAAAFVGYFAIAIGYHRRVDDGALLTGPAVLYGIVAARTFAADFAALRIPATV